MLRKILASPTSRPLTAREKRITRRLSFFIVVASLCFLWMYALKTNARAALKDQSKLIDSLKNDNFYLLNMVGRYELTMDHLKEVDSAAAAEAERFLNHETE